MPLIRIEPHIFVMTPLGRAEAHFLLSPDNVEVYAEWCCFQSETKENWWWPAPMVRLCSSITGIRDGEHSDIIVSDEYLETLRPHILRHKESPFYDRCMCMQSGQIGSAC
jgi:hypothetical protein